MPDPATHVVDPALNGHAAPPVPDQLRRIREWASEEHTSRRSPPLRILAAVVQATAGLVTSGSVPQRAADEFIRHVAESIGLDADEIEVKQTVARHFGKYIVNEDGKIIPTLPHNSRVAIAKLGVRVARDVFAWRDVLTGLEGFGPYISDDAVVRLRLRVEEEFGFLPSKELFYDVLSSVAQDNRFDPVAAYLNEQQERWDGTPRLDRWLTTYCRAEDTPFNRAVGRIMLIAGTRRVRKPGCKFDEMLVLESPQGQQKSTALRILAVREDWFSDGLHLGGRTKEAMEVLEGRWIVEASELSGMRKGEIEGIKAFLSRGEDVARLAYGRITTHRPRRFIVIGTTNSPKYLRDSTGNRRFWPVPVGIIDIVALRRDRDQLWGEAAKAEADGESIRLDPALWAAAAAVQEGRMEVHPFEEFLAPILDGQAGAVRTDDLWRAIGKGTPGDRTQADNSALGQTMHRLGWTATRRWWGGGRQYGYTRGTGNKRLRLRHTGEAWACEPDTGDERGLGV